MGWLGTAVNTVFPGTGSYVEDVTGLGGGVTPEEQIKRSGAQFGESALRLGRVQAAATSEALQKQIEGLQRGRGQVQGAQPEVTGGYQRAIGAITPFAEAGRGVLPALETATLAERAPLTPRDLLQTPGVQFRLGEAQKALERGASARGTLLSGGHQRELGRYMQELASQEYGAETERRRLADQDRIRAMQSLVQTGLAAGGTEASARQQLADLQRQYAGTEAGFEQELAGLQAEKHLRPHEIRVQAGLAGAGAGQLAQQYGAQAQQQQQAGRLQALGAVGGAVLGGPIGGAIASQMMPKRTQLQQPQQQPVLVG